MEAFSPRYSSTMRLLLSFLALPLLAACSQMPPAVTAPAPPPAVQTQSEAPVREADEYTRYELLDPASAQFRILFEVTAIKPGATFYFNPIRKGSAASDESVRDLATSRPLRFEVVSGEEARASGLPEADLATSYIRIHLPRPVPQDGGIRLLILQRSAELPAERHGPDRLLSHAGHPPKFDRSPRGLRADHLQRSGPDPARTGWTIYRELHAHRSGGVPAGPRSTADRRSQSDHFASRRPAPVGNGRTRTARSSISCSRRNLMPSISTTTTPSRGPA